MIQIPDAPWIREDQRRPQRLCPACGYDIGDTAYEIDGDLVCEECFSSWVQDYLMTNPEDVAKALSVPTTWAG